jgi:hypothetical protein
VTKVRSRHQVMAGRLVAAVALAGLGVYFWVAGVGRAAAVAGPVTAVIALAALIAPYLLPVHERREPPGQSDHIQSAGPGTAHVVIIADRGSAAAQHIDQVTINAPSPDRGAQPGGTSK